MSHLGFDRVGPDYFVATDWAEMADLFNRLQCSATVLRALQGKAQRDRVSCCEAATIVRMVQSTTIPADDVATAMTRVAKVGFQSKDEDTIIEALSAKFLEHSEAPAPSAPTGPVILGGWRPKQQNFTSFVHFLPASAWIEIEDSGTMSKAAEVLVALGLRSPTEATLRDLAMAYLMATEGPEAARLMPERRRTSFKSVPRQYLMKAKEKAPAPETWQLVLEESPEALRLRRPGVFASVYSTEEAAPMPISSVDYEWLRTHTLCRSPKVAKAGEVLPASSSSSSDVMAPMMEMLKLVLPQLQSEKRPPALEGLKIFNRSPLNIVVPKKQEEPEARTEAPEATAKPNDEAIVPPPEKKAKLTVGDATVSILGMMLTGEDSKAKAGGAKAAAKEVANKKVRVRYEHVVGEHMFKTYYNKLPIKVWEFHWETGAGSGPPTARSQAMPLSLSGPSTA